MYEHIGQIFNNPIQLLLLPGTKLPVSYYQVTIQYATEVLGATMHHNSSFISSSELVITMGNDVKFIDVMISDLNRWQVFKQYSIRVDHLILLNLANKLL